MIQQSSPRTLLRPGALGGRTSERTNQAAHPVYEKMACEPGAFLEQQQLLQAPEPRLTPDYMGRRR